MQINTNLNFNEEEEDMMMGGDKDGHNPYRNMLTFVS